VSVLILKYPIRFDNKFVQPRRTNDKFVTQTRPDIYSSTTNVVCASSTNCVLLQLPASSLYDRRYSCAHEVTSLMSQSAMSHRHLSVHV